MPEIVNPYAPPAEVNEPAEDPAAVALRRLGGPAMGLIILSGMNLPGVILVPFMPIIVVVQLFNEPPHVRPLILLGWLAFSVMTVSNCFILFGAWKMRNGTSYHWAYRAAVLSCIPVLSASGYLGIPFGIWALFVLLRHDVKKAFAAKATESANVLQSESP
jgi:hypothetical protein